MADFPLPLIKRVVRETLFEWVRKKYTLPIDRIFSQISTRERLGPRERDSSNRVIYEIVRHWNDFLPRAFDPQQSSHLHKFEDVVNALLSQNLEGIKKHLSSKPKFKDDPAEHLKKTHPLPDFLYREIMSSQEGVKAWHDYLHNSYERAPLFVRLNQSLNPLEKAEAEKTLLHQGAIKSPFVKNCFRFMTPQNLSQWALFQEGLIEVQDEHSQLAALLIKPQKNEKILDLCAGAGGKTLHISDLLSNQSEIYAYDSDSRRLSNLIPRAKKRGLTSIKILEEIPRGQKFDTILVDAPCSGLGTLRRSPDRLFSFTSEEAQRLRSIQTNLLLTAKSLLSENGKILYITCTPRPEENLKLLASLFAQEKLSPLNLVSYLRTSSLIEGEKLLSKSRQSSSFEIAKAYSPFSGTSWPSECFLTMGPESRESTPPIDQASDALLGDSFFFALVQ